MAANNLHKDLSNYEYFITHKSSTVQKYLKAIKNIDSNANIAATSIQAMLANKDSLCKQKALELNETIKNAINAITPQQEHEYSTRILTNSKYSFPFALSVSKTKYIESDKFIYSNGHFDKDSIVYVLQSGLYGLKVRKYTIPNMEALPKIYWGAYPPPYLGPGRTAMSSNDIYKKVNDEMHDLQTQLDLMYTMYKPLKKAITFLEYVKLQAPILLSSNGA